MRLRILAPLVRGGPARVWRRAVLGLVVVLAGTLVANAVSTDLSPDSRWGLGYGIAAVVVLAIVAAYGLRRKSQRLSTRLGLGRTHTWQVVHLWGGILFGLLVLAHSAFRVPSGMLTGLLWGVALWTVFSGLVGWGLQRWLPRVLASLENEVLYERIPVLCEQIVVRSRALVDEAPEQVATLARRRLLARSGAPTLRWRALLGGAGGAEIRLPEAEHLRRYLPEADHPRLDELEDLYRARLEIDTHFTLQRLLRGWLALHVPASFLLVVLVAAHVAVVLLY